FGQIAQVDITAVLPGRHGADHAAALGRNREDALKWRQRQGDARQELHRPRRAVQIEIADLPVWELVGKRAGAESAGVDVIDAPINRDEALEVNGQHVARLGTPYAEGTDDRMPARGPQPSDLLD